MFRHHAGILALEWSDRIIATAFLDELCIAQWRMIFELTYAPGWTGSGVNDGTEIIHCKRRCRYIDISQMPSKPDPLDAPGQVSNMTLVLILFRADLGCWARPFETTIG